MGSLDKLVKWVMNFSFKQKKESIYILFLIIKSYLLVRFVPLRLYCSKYLYLTPVVDMQPYVSEIRFIRKILNYIPLRITCLMESIVVQLYLFSRFNVKIPICIGIKKDHSLLAHAWDMDSKNEGYKRLKI